MTAAFTVVLVAVCLAVMVAACYTAWAGLRFYLTAAREEDPDQG